ncbi:recombinase XerD, partial [Bacillus thuringiensis]|nr:recombinase XerD [Bacillus thuringiensis]
MVSNTSYKPKVTLEKKDELLQLLQGYWINDVWNLRDNFFEVYDSKESWRSNKKRIDFTSFSSYIRQEL